MSRRERAGAALQGVAISLYIGGLWLEIGPQLVCVAAALVIAAVGLALIIHG